MIAVNEGIFFGEFLGLREDNCTSINDSKILKSIFRTKKYLFNVKTRKLTYHPKTIQNIFQINFEKLEIIPI